MRQLSLIILSCCCWVVVSAQTQRPWKPYKIVKRDFVDSIQWAKKSVKLTLLTVRVDSIRTDSGRKYGYRLERYDTIKEVRTYTRDSVKSTFTVGGNIFHVEDSKKKLLERTVPVITYDSAYTRDASYYPTGTIVKPGDTASITYDINRDTSDLSRSMRVNIYNRYFFTKYYKKARLSLGVSYSPQFAYRAVLVNDPKFNDPAILDSRADNERLLYGQTFSALVGIALGRTHTIYAEYINMQQGFKSIKSFIDWNTGLPQPAAEDRKYRFISNGVGVGYFKTGVDHRINLAADMGFSVLFLKCYDDGVMKDPIKDEALKTDPVTAGLKRTTLMGKFGIGINCRIWNEYSVKMIPTIYYNFTPASAGEQTLRTRLFNIGLTTGIMFAHKANKTNKTDKQHKQSKSPKGAKSETAPAKPGTTDKPKTEPKSEKTTPKAAGDSKKP